MFVRQMTNEDLCRFGNQVKDLIADKLHVEDLKKCAIVIIEKGMFGRAWEKLFGANDNARIRLMIDVPEKAS